MVRVVWFVIMVFSLIEIFLIYAEWFKNLRSCREKGEYGKIAGNYFKLFIKSIIPVILALTGLMAAFLR